VVLNHIVPKGENQLDLFSNDSLDNEALNKVMDEINKRFGPKMIKSAACGIHHSWKLNANYISRRFTTNWSEILEI
jgi:DNA polymerase V